jgi:HD-GYP domain-containing protein (c-di-GMP phosphodiesterase class II)
MAVADVFTALTENRPYRAGMDRKETLGILTRMGKTDHLDREALSLLEKNYEYLEEIRRTAQARELNQYLRLHRSEENPG